jgi:hypothetical protein
LKSPTRGGVAARAAVGMAKRGPVPLQATDMIGPHLPAPIGSDRKRLPRVRKPSSGHDVVYAPTSDIDAHQVELREAFGDTLSDQFVEAMTGKLISGLRPNPFEVLAEATLNAAIAVISSIKANELEAFMATQTVIAVFSGLRMMELSQRARGRPFDYRWPLDPGTLRKIALKFTYPTSARIETIQRVLEVREYVDCTKQLAAGRAALDGLNKATKARDLDAARSLTFDEAVRLGSSNEKPNLLAQKAAE